MAVPAAHPGIAVFVGAAVVPAVPTLNFEESACLPWK